tara:strand:- start:163 stop:312 length:150 start_codon:yes stop_codon:yes gene_type:complete
LEEIDYLCPDDLGILKKFKKLKYIGQFSVPNKSNDEEYIKATIKYNYCV